MKQIIQNLSCSHRVVNRPQLREVKKVQKVLEYGTRRKVGSVVYKKQKLNKWLHMGWVTPHAPNAELKERQTLPKIFPNESSSTTHIDENTCHQNWVKAMHIF